MKAMILLLLAIQNTYPFEYVPSEINFGILLHSSDPLESFKKMRVLSKKMRASCGPSYQFSSFIRILSTCQGKHPIAIAFDLSTPEAENYIEAWLNKGKIGLHSFPCEKYILLANAQKELLQGLADTLMLEWVHSLPSNKFLIKRQIVLLSRLSKENIYVKSLQKSILDTVDKDSIVIREKMFQDLVELRMDEYKPYVRLYGSIKPLFNQMLDTVVTTFDSHLRLIGSYPLLPPVEYCCFVIETLRLRGAIASKVQEKCIKKNKLFIGNILRCCPTKHQLPY